ncbi:hypothetical protein [Pleomorphochaeta sp. DL1XJH-081]|uniref:hypothetical protein n=1 Tax=Pleomorphochaeta sp. DL1XJH-081 TaxID=3409690 RepID=UPI003BB50089
MHYYMMVSPTEALIASMLDSSDFASYMATGPRKTTSEQLIFAELTGEFGSDFDWDYAHRACRAHPDGSPKHSVYLSVYRVLERVPLSHLGNLFLVAKDGRSLQLSPGDRPHPEHWRGYALYKELCPVTPLVASSLPPEPFSRYLLDSTNHISVPAIVFADVKIIDLDNPGHSDNGEDLYDYRGREHLRSCFDEVRKGPGKRSKTIDRSADIHFTYRSIADGIYFARYKDGIVFYPMPDRDEIREHHYEWGRSANFY